MVNVTPTTPPAFPIIYTTNQGQVYEIASVSGLGCADTVYSMTYNGTAYNIYAVLPPNQALQVIEAYEYQFGLGNIACSSLIQEAEYYNGATPTSATSINLSSLINMYGGMIAELFFWVLIIVVLIGASKWIYDKFEGRRR
jgi:hypothetical protein